LRSVSTDGLFQRDSPEFVVSFIETEDIRKVREGKRYPISPAISERFSHKGLAVLSRFLVFTRAFDRVVVDEYRLPYVQVCDGEIEFEAQSYF
jgi:hypothetical protein